MNNRQDSNEISYEVIKLKAHHAWHEKRIAGDPSLDFYDGYDIGFNAGLKYKSNIINEPITDKEIDAEIERYIKQFWPRPEHGGAVRLGFKRAVRWMQERGAKSDFLHVLEENYEATKRMSEMQIALTTKYALLETYEDLIAIYKSNYTEATKPINNEPLREKFRSVIIEEYGNIVLNSLVKKCVQVAEQYAASKLNNTIEDKWISSLDLLPESGQNILIHNKDYGIGIGYFNPLNGEFAGHFHGNVSFFKNIDGVYWQPLPKAPNQ